MADQVILGALLQCTFGSAPVPMVVTPKNNVIASMVPAANIDDYIPITNIPTFVMCSSPSNPTVASATAAALGVLTPMPCVPATSSPWSPGSSNVLLANKPALNNSSKCTCSYGGSISINFAGQTQLVQIP